MTNLTKLLKEQEERLKKMQGSKYRNPLERLADEIAEEAKWLLNHSENEVLDDLPFVEAG